MNTSSQSHMTGIEGILIEEIPFMPVNTPNKPENGESLIYF